MTIRPAPVRSIAGLSAMAIRGRARMYVPQEKMFYFCRRKGAEGVQPEGRSRRYGAIPLIGLATEAPEVVAGILHGHSALAVCEHLASDVDTVSNLGDVGLTAWAAALLGLERRERLWKRIEQLRPVESVQPVVELAWTLVAACVDKDIASASLRDGLAARIKSSIGESSAVFPHVLGQGGTRAAPALCGGTRFAFSILFGAGGLPSAPTFCEFRLWRGRCRGVWVGGI